MQHRNYVQCIMQSTVQKKKNETKKFLAKRSAICESIEIIQTTLLYSATNNCCGAFSQTVGGIVYELLWTQGHCDPCGTRREVDKKVFKQHRKWYSLYYRFSRHSLQSTKARVKWSGKKHSFWSEWIVRCSVCLQLYCNCLYLWAMGSKLKRVSKIK